MISNIKSKVEFFYMEDYTRTIFRNAIIQEQAAQKLYKNLAKKTNNKIIKNIFLKLAEEEAIHELLFKKMDLSILKKVNRTELLSVNLLNDVIDGEVIVSEEVLNDIIRTLDYAIAQEQKAYDDYMFFVKYMQHGEAKTALKEAALQEARHKTILMKIQLEFNKEDW